MIIKMLVVHLFARVMKILRRNIKTDIFAEARDQDRADKENLT